MQQSASVRSTAAIAVCVLQPGAEVSAVTVLVSLCERRVQKLVPERLRKTFPELV